METTIIINTGNDGRVSLTSLVNMLLKLQKTHGKDSDVVFEKAPEEISAIKIIVSSYEGIE